MPLKRAARPDQSSDNGDAVTFWDHTDIKLRPYLMKMRAEVQASDKRFRYLIRHGRTVDRNGLTVTHSLEHTHYLMLHPNVTFTYESPAPGKWDFDAYETRRREVHTAEQEMLDPPVPAPLLSLRSKQTSRPMTSQLSNSSASTSRPT